MQAERPPERIQNRLTELDEAAAALRQFGEERDVPVLEHEAARLQDIIAVLSLQVPNEMAHDE